MADNTEKRESPSGQDTTRKMAKKLKTAKQKLTESFKSSALKEFYREKYKNNRRINKSYERNHNKLHRRHSPGTSSLEDLFRPDDTTDGNKQDDAEQKMKGLCKDVKLSLVYFEAIVCKNITEQYAGSATKILETVMTIVDQLSKSSLSPEQSSVLMSCRSRVVQSLAQLIHWSDRTLLNSVKSNEDKPIKEIVQSVLSAVEDLVEESIKKLQSHNNNSAPVTPLKAMKPPWPTVDDDALAVPPPKPPLPLDRQKTPPLPPKMRHSGSKPVGIVMPFNISLDQQQSSNTVFGVQGLTRSEESLLDHNNQQFSLDAELKNGLSLREGADRSSMCSSNFSDTTYDDASSESSMMKDMDRAFKSSLNSKKSAGYDDDYERLRLDSTCSNTNDYPTRPLSDPNVLLLRLSITDESNIIASGHSWSSLLQARNGERLRNTVSNSEGDVSGPPPALPAKQRHSLANKHLSDISHFSIGSMESVDTVSSSPDEDEKPPPLPVKQKTIQAYMQMFFSEAQAPPMAEIVRQTAKRYHHSSFGSNSSIEVTPQHGPMKASYQPSYDTQSTYSSSSTGRHRDSIASITSTTSDISSSSLSVNHTPPALPPKVRRSTLESINTTPLSPRNNSVSDLPTQEPPEKESPLPVKIKPMLFPDKQSRKSIGKSELRRSIKHKENEKNLDSIIDPGDLLDRIEVLDFIAFTTAKDEGSAIMAGCIDALIVYAAENKKNLLYYEAFLTTYRSFITPMELLKKLLYRYEKFGKDENREYQRASRNSFFLLLRVVDELSLVDISDKILELLMQLVYQLLFDGNLTLAKLLRTKILAKHQHRLSNIADSIMGPLASLRISSKVMTVMDFSSERLAEQMTMLDFDLFQKIEIPEVLQWAKEQSEELSPHLTAFTEHFNKMSYWTRTIILNQDKPQDREKLLNKFIRIMRHLRHKLNNFNSYLAILSALDSAPVRRLEWQRQTTDGLREYCQLIDSSSSFRTYREALGEASPPCIPYLGLILQDLTFIHLGNKDELRPGVINFRKRWQQFNILDSMRRFKQSQYLIEKDQNMIDMFDNFNNHLAEDALWDLSLKIKPRVKRPKRIHVTEDTSSRRSSTITTDSTSTSEVANGHS